MTATETKVTLKPLSNRVVVEVLESKEQTSGGIYLPETAKEKPMTGIVVSVGPGKVLENGQREPMSLKAGDKVLFGKYAGTEFKQGDQELKIMAESDILAIIEA